MTTKKITTAICLILALCILSGCSFLSPEKDNAIISKGSVNIIPESCTVNVGETLPLEYEVSPSLADDLVWSVVGGDYVTVSQTGVISAVKAGMCMVVAKAQDYSDTVTVNVVEDNNYLKFVQSNKVMTVGTTYKLEYTATEGVPDKMQWSASNGNVTVTQEGIVTAVSAGQCVVTVTAGKYSASIEIVVTENTESEQSIELVIEEDKLFKGDRLQMDAQFVSENVDNANVSAFEYEIVSGENNATVTKDILTGTQTGTVTVRATYGNYFSNEVEIEILDPDAVTDPYASVSEYEFYLNYTPADSSVDAYFRSQHGFMSGDIAQQDQEPTVSSSRPESDGLYVRNTASLYSEDGTTYYIFDTQGNIVNAVYKGGAYVTLEEVAAYLFAFGDIPANYTESKYTSPSTSVWGKYLRLNHTYFSGDTDKYPYEPILPDISGCGGDLDYYELDIGTTGTDCDPAYPAEIYNDGKSITRGAARIVYTRYDANNSEIDDINEKYLFYTYNHYNDFQEYLNYEGGWGEMFGNITGGGTISSKVDYNPTPYVPTARQDFFYYGL